MDKKIKNLVKITKKLKQKELALLKEDKKRDKECEMGKMLMKKKKK